MRNAYVVGHISIKDPEKWDAYRRQVPDTLLPWHAELVFRGKKDADLSGDSPYSDIVVIRFPDIAAVGNWFSSPAYQALIPLRQQAAEVVLTSYQA